MASCLNKLDTTAFLKTLTWVNIFEKTKKQNTHTFICSLFFQDIDLNKEKYFPVFFSIFYLLLATGSFHWIEIYKWVTPIIEMDSIFKSKTDANTGNLFVTKVWSYLIENQKVFINSNSIAKQYSIKGNLLKIRKRIFVKNKSLKKK